MNVYHAHNNEIEIEFVLFIIISTIQYLIRVSINSFRRVHFGRSFSSRVISIQSNPLQYIK